MELMYFLPSSLIQNLLFLPWRMAFHTNLKFPTQGIKPKMGDWLSNYAVGTLYCFTEPESEGAFVLHCRHQGLQLCWKKRWKFTFSPVQRVQCELSCPPQDICELRELPVFCSFRHRHLYWYESSSEHIECHILLYFQNSVRELWVTGIINVFF